MSAWRLAIMIGVAVGVDGHLAHHLVYFTHEWPARIFIGVKLENNGTAVGYLDNPAQEFLAIVKFVVVSRASEVATRT